MKLISLLLTSFLFVNQALSQEFDVSYDKMLEIKNTHAPSYINKSKLGFIELGKNDKTWSIIEYDFLSEISFEKNYKLSSSIGTGSILNYLVSDSSIFLFYSEDSKSNYKIFAQKLDLTTKKITSEKLLLNYTKENSTVENINTSIRLSEDGNLLAIGLVETIIKDKNFMYATGLSMFSFNSNLDIINSGKKSLNQEIVFYHDYKVGSTFEDIKHDSYHYLRRIRYRIGNIFDINISNESSVVVLASDDSNNGKKRFLCLELDEDGTINTLLDEDYFSFYDFRLDIEEDNLNLICTDFNSLYWYQKKGNELSLINEFENQNYDMIAGFQVLNDNEILIATQNFNLFYNCVGGASCIYLPSTNEGDIKFMRISKKKEVWSTVIPNKVSDKEISRIHFRGKNFRSFYSSDQIIAFVSDPDKSLAWNIDINTGEAQIIKEIKQTEKLEVLSYNQVYSVSNLLEEYHDQNVVLWKKKNETSSESYYYLIEIMH